jgi:hypothetical protein
MTRQHLGTPLSGALYLVKDWSEISASSILRFMSEKTIRITQGAMDRALPIALVPLWGEYPQVEARARLRYEGRHLHVRFMATEPQLRRMVTDHNGRVWEDSCVEIFLQREGQDEYVNVECSASTKMLVARGTNREDRERWPIDFIDKIPCSVTILENSTAKSRWKAEIALDLVALGLVGADEPMGEVVLRGNLYKCGDKLKEPHYLAAFPIGTLKPDFHRPEFFVRFSFED